MPDGGLRRVVILTAIEVEYKAVRAYLTNLRRESRGKVHYQRGTFSTTNQEWDVVIRQTGRGNVRAAVETLLAIHYFHPVLVLFIGVAGGLKDVRLGDVVIPTKVYDYESGRANVTSYQTRPDVVKPTFSLSELAQAEAIEKGWLQRLPDLPADAQPHVLAAPIASGENVVASKRSAIYRFLKANFSDAVAVEMESFGFLLAAYYHPDVEALVIRGISDLLDNKVRTDHDNFQVLAARHASAFAFEILAKVDLTDAQRGDEAHNEPAINTGRITAAMHESAVEPSDVPAVSKEETELASQQTTAPSLKEPEIALIAHIPSQKFLALLQQYKDEIREIHELFGEGRMTFYDQCQRAIQLIRRLDALIKERYKHLTHTNRISKFKVDKLNEHLRDLLSELGDFSRIRFSAEQDYRHASLQKKIRDGLNLLIEKLEQLQELEQTMNQSEEE